MNTAANQAARKNANEVPVIAYEGIRKVYGNFVALDGVTAHVDPDSPLLALE